MKLWFVFSGVFERNRLISRLCFMYIFLIIYIIFKKKISKKYVDYIKFGGFNNFSLLWVGILLLR